MTPEERLKATGEVINLPIDSLRPDFQADAYLDPEKVQVIAYSIRDGEQLEPLRAYFDGREYWVADGFHRLKAAKLEGLRSVDVEVIPGTYEDLQADWKLYNQKLREELARWAEANRQGPASSAKAPDSGEEDEGNTELTPPTEGDS